MTPPLPDRELVDRFLASRSEEAFLELYDRHAGRMFGLARRLLGLRGPNPADAEDVLQAAWIRAVRRLPQFRWESSLSTWLCGFVVNCCREFRPFHVTELEERTAPAPAERLDLETALAGLAPGYRAVLLLHDLEGFTHEEIARLLGIDSGTSKSQLSRARAAMRRALDPDWRTP